MTNSARLLGVNLDLIDPKNAQSTIVKSCAKCWFEKNGSGLYNWGDCSGFVKAVQTDLMLRPFHGLASQIFDELETRTDWLILGAGSQALAQAGIAANSGALTVGVWKSPITGRHGHIAIITAYLPMLGRIPEQHAIGGWGQLHSVGRLLDSMSRSFGRNKHSYIRYAKCLTPVL